MAETVKSEITGKVWKITREIGEQVSEQDQILIIESMKMEIPVLASIAGILKEILVQEGDDISEGQALATIE